MLARTVSTSTSARTRGVTSSQWRRTRSFTMPARSALVRSTPSRTRRRRSFAGLSGRAASSKSISRSRKSCNDYSTDALGRRLLGPSIEKVTFRVDNDAGLIAACVAASADLFSTRAAECAVVTFRKGATIDEKRAEVAEGKALLDAHCAAMPLFPRLMVADLVFGNDLRRGIAGTGAVQEDYLGENDVPYPFVSMAEPGKKIRLVAGGLTMDWPRIAKTYRRASLHPVDRVFMLCRRRVSFFERGFASPRRGRRIWNQYAYYDPTQIEKLGQIFRFNYNFILRGEDKKTPAMRMGLARG